VIRGGISLNIVCGEENVIVAGQAILNEWFYPAVIN
jgi:hypothetical protein